MSSSRPIASGPRVRSVTHSLSASKRRVVCRERSTWLGSGVSAGLRYAAWCVQWRSVRPSRTSTAEQLTGWNQVLWKSTVTESAPSIPASRSRWAGETSSPPP